MSRETSFTITTTIPGTDDNGSSHIKAALLSPFIVIPFVNGEITIGPWQNLTLVECDTRNRVRDIVFQVMGE